jgi:hypothetical protein
MALEPILEWSMQGGPHVSFLTENCEELLDHVKMHIGDKAALPMFIIKYSG